MGFTVVVAGRAERAVFAELVDLLGAAAITTRDQSTFLAVADQSQLVSVLGRLNDLGIAVGEVLHRSEAPGQEERP